MFGSMISKELSDGMKAYRVKKFKDQNGIHEKASKSNVRGSALDPRSGPSGEEQAELIAGGWM